MVITQLPQSLITTHSFETSVLEQGNIKNMQDNGPRGPELENPVVVQKKK